MRTLVDIPEEDLRWLDQKAGAEGKSRAAVVREALAAYRADRSGDWIDRGFALWKDREDFGDSVQLQRRLRAEWTRPWDPDYDEVRAEFPELFTEEDDRERERHRR